MKNNTSTFKILTFNTGLLRIKLPFYSYEFTPHLEERLSVLPGEIKKLNPDIIALQEIYLNDHKDFLLSKLQDKYPYHYSNTKKRRIGLGDGLLLISKYPISNSSYTHFKKAPILEKLIVKKGFICTTVTLPNKFVFEIINTHTTAGGILYGPESKKTEKYRQSEQKELKKHVKTNIQHPHVILGDFNCSPCVSPHNFEHLLNDEWNSTYDAYHSNNPKLLNEDMYPTWEINNPLNKLSPHADSPNQRIDHIFVTPSFNKKFTTVNSEIVFKDSIVFLKTPHKKLANTNVVTLSDHYGVLTTFESSEQ